MDCVHAVYSFTFDCRYEFVVRLFVLTTNTYRFQLNSKLHFSVAVCNYIDVRMICDIYIISVVIYMQLFSVVVALHSPILFISHSFALWTSTAFGWASIAFDCVNRKTDTGADLRVFVH